MSYRFCSLILVLGLGEYAIGQIERLDDLRPQLRKPTVSERTCFVFPPQEADPKKWREFANRKLPDREGRILQDAVSSLRNPLDEVRRNMATIALQRLGHVSTADVLWDVASNGFADARLRAWCIEALASIPHPQLLDRLVECVGDPRISVDAARLLLLLVGNSIGLTETELFALQDFYEISPTISPEEADGGAGYTAGAVAAAIRATRATTFGGIRSPRDTPYGRDVVGDRIRHNTIPAEFTFHCKTIQKRFRHWLDQGPHEVDSSRAYYFSLLGPDVNDRLGVVERQRVKAADNSLVAVLHARVPITAQRQLPLPNHFPVKRDTADGRRVLCQLAAMEAMGTAISSESVAQLRAKLEPLSKEGAALLNPLASRNDRKRAVDHLGPDSHAGELGKRSLAVVATNRYDDDEIRRVCISQLMRFPSSAGTLVRCVADPRVSTPELIRHLANVCGVEVEGDGSFEMALSFGRASRNVSVLLEVQKKLRTSCE